MFYVLLIFLINQFKYSRFVNWSFRFHIVLEKIAGESKLLTGSVVPFGISWEKNKEPSIPQCLLISRKNFIFLQLFLLSRSATKDA